MARNKSAGFSLIELLIVVTIIGIVASIAIPNLLATRRAANEGSAQQSMRTIASCQMTYLHTDGAGSYTDLTGLGQKTLTDTVLSTGTKSGYSFVVNPAAGSTPTYWAYAIPTITTGIGKTGSRRFSISEDGVLRGDSTLTAPADATEAKNMPPMGN
jgi:prepilin-type N-terminal cleavage/methylation domain-containing protein